MHSFREPLCAFDILIEIEIEIFENILDMVKKYHLYLTLSDLGSECQGASEGTRVASGLMVYVRTTSVATGSVVVVVGAMVVGCLVVGSSSSRGMVGGTQHRGLPGSPFRLGQ